MPGVAFKALSRVTAAPPMLTLRPRQLKTGSSPTPRPTGFRPPPPLFLLSLLASGVRQGQAESPLFHQVPQGVTLNLTYKTAGYRLGRRKTSTAPFLPLSPYRLFPLQSLELISLTHEDFPDVAPILSLLSLKSRWPPTRSCVLERCRAGWSHH